MIDLSGLDDDQRVAATAPRGPVCILAGAGTGKTRTITYRIAHLIDQGLANPHRVLAVTFTNRAAGEMRDRLIQMGIRGVQARTFHAATLRQLKFFWPQAVGDLPWQLMDNKALLVSRAARSVGLPTAKENVRDLIEEITWAKATLVAPKHYAERVNSAGRDVPFDAEKVAEVYRRYEAAKNREDGRLLDFDDLLLYTAAMLENSPGIAERFREQYRTFVVDEYQDVNPLQQRVLDAWLGGRDDLTVVGDANQTIYSFTGATPNYLLSFSHRFPEAVTVKLQRDYRSTPQVTSLANRVIGKATGRVAATRLELEGMRPAGPEPDFHAYPDDDAEARDITGRILGLRKAGVPASEIAILYRMNSQSAPFEQALADAGVVYQVRGGEGFFEQPAVRQARSALVRAAHNELRFREDDPLLDRPLTQRIRAVLAGQGLSAQEPEGAQARERWQLLDALAALCDQIVASQGAETMQDVLVELERRARDKQPPSVEGVTLSTLHAAKGLEWDAVFLVGLSEKLLPISYTIAKGSAAIEEERRLFYVGITRAREHLHCSWALARQEEGREARTPTRFLDGIISETAPQHAQRVRHRPRRCRVCGKPLETSRAKVLGRHEECPGDADSAAFEALRSWRSTTARELGVPAYVVFSDATLVAIAERMPCSEAELLDISGVGPIKLERYGQELLPVIRRLCGSSTRGIVGGAERSRRH